MGTHTRDPNRDGDPQSLGLAKALGQAFIDTNTTLIIGFLIFQEVNFLHF